MCIIAKKIEKLNDCIFKYNENMLSSNSDFSLETTCSLETTDAPGPKGGLVATR